jgi:hypothetical protein
MVHSRKSIGQRLADSNGLTANALVTIVRSAARTSAIVGLSLASTLGSVASAFAQTPSRTAPQRPALLPPKASTAGTDLIILRDHSRRPGKLEMCGISACLIAKTVVERSHAEWIGLDVRQRAEPVPPALRDLAKDEVFLADGSVHAGAVLSVLSATVATVSGSYPRQQVRWVHLAAAGKKGFTSGSDVTPPGQQSGSQSPGRSDPTTGKSGRGSGEAKPDTRTSGPAGSPPGEGAWIGVVRVEETTTYTSPRPDVFHKTATLHLHLREVEGTRARIQGKPDLYFNVLLANDNSSVSYSYDDTSGCASQASATFSDEGSRTSGQIWYPLPGPGASRAQPQAAGYLLNMSGSPGPQQKACPNLSIFHGFGLPAVVGWKLAWELPTPEARREEWLDPDGYRYLSGGNSRMFGNYRLQKTIASGDQAGSIDRKLEWDICRLGSSGCQPPDLTQNCRPSASHVSACDAQRERLTEELKKQWHEYQNLLAQANQDKAAYQKVVEVCAAGDMAMKLATYLIGPVENKENLKKISEEANETREALKLIAEFTQKMINEENPLVIAHSEKENLQDLATLQGAVEAIAEAGSLFAGITPERMREHLQECSTPIDDATYQAALSYVRNLEALQDLAPELRTTINNIRQLDIQCADEQWQAYKDCVDNARCQQRDPSGCSRLKPGPDWPDAS